MKENLLFFVFGVIFLTVNSQTKLIEGDLTKKEKGMHPKLFDVADNEDIITYAFNKKEKLLSHYNKELTLIKEKKISNLIIGDIKEIIIKKDTVNLISYIFDKKKQEIIFYRYYGSIEDLELQEEQILVLDNKTIKSFLVLL